MFHFLLYCVFAVAFANRHQTRKPMAKYLTDVLKDQDFLPSHWPRVPEQAFEHYSHVLSEVFAKQLTRVNFVLVGACDGTFDSTVDYYLKHGNWRGVFVEPMAYNIADMRSRFEKFAVTNRSTILHAAASSVCSKDTIQVTRPLYEEKTDRPKTESNHWLRRQIGGVPPDGETAPKNEWIYEDVKCVTGAHIMFYWREHMKMLKVGNVADLNLMKKFSFPNDISNQKNKLDRFVYSFFFYNKHCSLFPNLYLYI